MCGIAAVMRRRGPVSAPPSGEEIRDWLQPPSGEVVDPAEVEDFAGRVGNAAQRMRGPYGIAALVRDWALREDVAACLARAEETCPDLPDDLADAIWNIRMDRLREARAIAGYLGEEAASADSELIANWWGIAVALSALDRLEVRGRDSAGLAIIVSAEGLEQHLASSGCPSAEDPLIRSGSRLAFENTAAFIYKVAAEIGELGDNTRALGLALAADKALHRAVALPGAICSVLAHTRWASVGAITEPNAHPVASPLSDGSPFVLAAVNGDVDNYAELVEEHGLDYPGAISTDSRVIPGLLHRRRREGMGLLEAFRSSVSDFKGSHAIVACALDDPSRLLLARQGSGQALYAGLSDDAFLVVSEPHALVEQTSSYLRLDGGFGGDGEIVLLDTRIAPTAAAAEVVVGASDAASVGAPGSESPAGEPVATDGIRRIGCDGLEMEVGRPTLTRISSADVHRGDFPHYLLKEISEAPASFAKTLAGRIVGPPGGRRADLGEALPFDLAGIRRIICIGQGTAAVAAMAMADVLAAELAGSGVSASALPASELSGFDLSGDMSDCLVVAVSQSGTTTDTNRTVDLAKARGALILAVVNRRESDLANRADGVLYTSDGRDVEMSVASTKAFYAQVAAGFLLGFALGERLKPGYRAEDEERRSELLAALETLPEAMQEVLRARPRIAEIARRLAPPRRHWATVGNGRNRLAAEELRIKLSELCYRTVSCDVTENKKHIDLSAEPLILVCAAGLNGRRAQDGQGDPQAVAKDVVKEVDIYRAHSGAPVVMTDHSSFSEVCDDVVQLPEVHPELAFVLAAMAGHLFAYEAALAIDAGAEPLRRTRAAVLAALEETPAGSAPDAAGLAKRLEPELRVHAEDFSRLLRSGHYDGHLPPSSAVSVSSLFRYVLGDVPLAAFELEFGRMGTPADALESLLAAVGEAADELKRPVDAIRHQAKTVTVGISRSEEFLLESTLAKAVWAAGASAERLSYETLSTLVGLSSAVARVNGSIRYEVDGDRIAVTHRSGVSLEFRSRVDDDPVLRGTKRQVCRERRVLLTKGRRDGRVILLSPEVRGGETVGLVLIHVELHDRLKARAVKEVLRRYRDRYNRLRNAVTETEVEFDERRLAEAPVLDLLTGDVYELADRWRQESQ